MYLMFVYLWISLLREDASHPKINKELLFTCNCQYMQVCKTTIKDYAMQCLKLKGLFKLVPHSASKGANLVSLDLQLGEIKF